MFGFVIGTLCFIALVKVARGAHHGRWHRGHPRAARRRWALRWAFRHLATTTAQEKVILSAVDALEGQRGRLRAELRASREDLAAAMKAESFDEARFRAAFERQQSVLAELQDAVLQNARKVFDTLEPDQRAQVSEGLEYGPHAFAHGC